MPLPPIDERGDKEERGRVLVVGGSAELPGAIVLAGTAALRAGAGKLKLATAAAVSAQVGVAVPEALVIGMRETRNGAFVAGGASRVTAELGSVDALLLGPGMRESRSLQSFLRRVVGAISAQLLVLDAAALNVLRHEPNLLHPLEGRVVLTPHAGEMAGMLGGRRDEIERDPLAAAGRAARSFRAVVMLKGATTFVATPQGEAFRLDEGDVGLATSGSGDVLAGIVVGLAAQGADAARTACWASFLHAAAGRALSSKQGRIGFLAREIAGELPPILQRLR
ncbi:MAG: NAD(P)H-hydrate dehydratase [Gemmatimonadota bacterium]|nr:NAD(P)H-hydrate dehydratase [Gemmatimonadota bacterium]